jgi:hypothetical protein
VVPIRCTDLSQPRTFDLNAAEAFVRLEINLATVDPDCSKRSMLKSEYLHSTPFEVLVILSLSGIDGDFDVCQSIVKRLLTDHQLSSELKSQHNTRITLVISVSPSHIISAHIVEK